MIHECNNAGNRNTGQSGENDTSKSQQHDQNQWQPNNGKSIQKILKNINTI